MKRVTTVRSGYEGSATKASPRGAAQQTAPAHDRHLAQHLLDLLHLVADEQDVGQIEMVRRGAGGVDDQVTRAQAEDPVSEQVVALLLDHHAGCVVRDLAAADLLADTQLP